MGLLHLLKAIFSPPSRRSAPPQTLYVAHRDSMIYHRDDCEYGSKMRHGRRFFRTQAKAVEEGFRPCKVCMPDRYPYRPGEWVPNIWNVEDLR